MEKPPLWLPALMLLATAAILWPVFSELWASVVPTSPENGTFYRLRLPPGGVDEAGRLVSNAISSEYASSNSPREGYPRLGKLELLDVPGKPGWKQATCAPGDAPVSQGSCIALDDRGDMVEMRVVDFPFAAFYPFVVYLAPIGGRVDRDLTPRIVMRVHDTGTPSRYLEMYRMLQTALRKAGARAFNPQMK